MDSGTSRLTLGSESVLDAGTSELQMELQHTGALARQQTSTRSQGQAEADAKPEFVVAQTDEQSATVHGPKGIRFALLFTCILLESFFVGFVRDNPCSGLRGPI